MHGLPIPKDGGATVLRCYSATVPFHFLHLTLHPSPSPFTPWLVRLPRFARQSAVAPQFLDFRSVSLSGKPPAITHRSCVSSYVPPPTPGPGQKEKKNVKMCVVFFLKKAKKKEDQKHGQGCREKEETCNSCITSLANGDPDHAHTPPTVASVWAFATVD